MLNSIRQKLFVYILTLISFVTIGAGIISTFELQKYFRAQLSRQMRTQIELIEFILKTPPATPPIYQYLTTYATSSHFRLTIINDAGLVLFDSKVPQDSLIFVENHGNRPEIRQAGEMGVGSDERLSRTINTGLFYLAIKIHSTLQSRHAFPSARYIRLSIPLQDIDEMMAAVQRKIIASGFIAFLIVACLSYFFSRRITDPLVKLTQIAEKIKHGGYDSGFSFETNDEIGQLSKVLDEMLRKLRDDVIQMDRLQKVRSQFLGNVSHELRTPIFTLQGYLETFLKSPHADEEKKRIFIEKAYKQAERLNMLLTDLIDISRIESGEMKMSFRYFSLQDWLQTLMADFENKARAAEIELALHLNTAMEKVQVFGDRQRLSQVMANLLGNAIKYNKKSGHVDILCKFERGKLKISVADTGPGIARKHHSRLFERFYRVDVQRSRDIGGTGLGLAIVKHIVDAHKGAIKVESVPGKGSTFSFLLKIKGSADRG